MKILLATLIVSLPFTVQLAAQEPQADFGQMRKDVLALGELTDPPKMYAAEGFETDGNIKPIFYDGLTWKGKPTRVFAWLGVPKTSEGKVPGIVLVHGGGGTAFKEWVKLWNDHGFAAISIAVEGQLERRVENSNARRAPWERHARAGPQRVGIFQDTDQPLKEQWMYHAQADTVLANSLLRSLPEVDENQVGLMGISWGGVITSTAIGIDERWAFAIPTYGCGHLFDSENQWGRALGENDIYRNVWDSMMYMSRVKIPVLWLSWPKDSHFPLDCLRATSQAGPGPRMISLIPGMGHSHQAGWEPAESYAFAKSIVEDGKPWCEFKGIHIDDARVQAEFISEKPLDKAVLVSTTETGFTGNRTWTEQDATLTKSGDTWMVKTELPQGTTGWFVNAKSGDLTVSSDFQGE